MNISNETLPQRRDNHNDELMYYRDNNTFHIYKYMYLYNTVLILIQMLMELLNARNMSCEVTII